MHNTALVLGPNGDIAGCYDKIHLFDASIAGTTYSASSVEMAGSAPTLVHIAAVGIGLTICYDVRFPELFRQLAGAGAEAFLVPRGVRSEQAAGAWKQTA